MNYPIFSLTTAEWIRINTCATDSVLPGRSTGKLDGQIGEFIGSFLPTNTSYIHYSSICDLHTRVEHTDFAFTCSKNINVQLNLLLR